MSKMLELDVLCRSITRRLIAIAAALASSVAVAQPPVDPVQLDRLRTEAVTLNDLSGSPARGVIATRSGFISSSLAGGATICDHPASYPVAELYRGLQDSGNGVWFWTFGGSETAYWALDDGQMGPGAVAVGGGHVTQYEFGIGLHADFASDTLRPYVIVNVYNAPFDPVAGATNPVVEPPQPVSQLGWIFDPITLPAAGFYWTRTGLIDLTASGLDFDLDDTFHVEIIPLEWSSYPAGAPVVDPDVFAVFTGPGSVSYGTNQDRMWSDFWSLQVGCDWTYHVYGNGDGYYQHPAEMYTGGCSPYLNQAPIWLRGLECSGANRLALNLPDPDVVCVKPGDNVTLTMSQSCLAGLVRGYQAFLYFDPTRLTFTSGVYATSPYGKLILNPITAVDGNIDLAAGIDDLAGEPPTSTSAELVTLNFTAGPSDGFANLIFRAAEPPTEFSDLYGQAVLPTLLNSPTICVDGTLPSITCPDDLNLQCVADIPPAAADFSEFVAQGGTAGDSGCYPDVTVTLEQQSDNDGTGCPAAPLVITRTYRATDCAGNYRECTQTITAVDNTPPEFVDFPADPPPQPADAGLCTAVLVPPIQPPTGTDNCTAVPTVTFTRSDGELNLTAPYPAGVTIITWRVADACGNQTSQLQTVTINAVNDVVATVQLGGGIYAAGPLTLTRCITFEFWTCPGTKQVVGVPIEFYVDAFGVVAPATVSFSVPCGAYSCVTARDKLHSLRRTLSSGSPIGLQIVGTQYQADFVVAGKPLIGGNFNDDKFIDILDFGVLSYQWLKYYQDGVVITPPPWTQNGNTPCGTVGPHADVDGDGHVEQEDYNFISGNFLKSRDDNCCGQPGFAPGGGDDDDGAQPVMSIPIAELVERGLGYLAVADLNGDGVLDQSDLAAFMNGERPRPPVSPIVPDRRIKRVPVSEVER